MFSLLDACFSFREINYRNSMNFLLFKTKTKNKFMGIFAFSVLNVNLHTAHILGYFGIKKCKYFL